MYLPPPHHEPAVGVVDMFGAVGGIMEFRAGAPILPVARVRILFPFDVSICMGDNFVDRFNFCFTRRSVVKRTIPCQVDQFQKSSHFHIPCQVNFCQLLLILFKLGFVKFQLQIINGWCTSITNVEVTFVAAGLFTINNKVSSYFVGQPDKLQTYIFGFTLTRFGIVLPLSYFVYCKLQTVHGIYLSYVVCLREVSVSGCRDSP